MGLGSRVNMGVCIFSSELTTLLKIPTFSSFACSSTWFYWLLFSSVAQAQAQADQVEQNPDAQEAAEMKGRQGEGITSWISSMEKTATLKIPRLDTD